jgi:uncharacterized protein YlxW (UPF0749 family)
MPDTETPTRDVPDVPDVPHAEGDEHADPGAHPAHGEHRGEGPHGTGGGDTGRDRLRAALLHPRSHQIVVALLLAALGFAAVVQVRTNDVDDSYSALREQDLIDVLSGLAGTSQRARSEIARLEQDKRDLQSDSRRQFAALQQAQKQADTLNILAGLVPVTGPGIRVTITEQTGPVDIDSVLDTIEELRSAGAEAMQVNGQVRVVAQSSLEDEVGGFSVDGTLVTSPYVIDVIGDPHTLHGALVFNQGPAFQLRDDGADVQIDELDRIDIESVHAADRPEFSQPE